MRRYVLRRLRHTLVMLFGLTLIVFGLLQLAPGNPADYLIPETVTDPGQRDRIIAELGLDQPPLVQYANWVSNAVRGDFGTAYTYRQPALEIIAARAKATFQLQAVVIVLSILIAIPAGVIAAVKRDSFLDHSITTSTLFGLSMPNFWFALLLIMFFSVRLQWLPAFGAGSDPSVWANWRHFVLPVTVLCLALVPWYARFVRAGMIENLNRDYIRTSRALGVRERRVRYIHALKPSLLPVITIIGLSLPRLIAGSVVVETIFAWPGIGRLAYDAIVRGDFPVVMALAVLTGAFVMVANLLTDIVYALVDPRVVLD